METQLYQDAQTILHAAIHAVKPDEAVRRALEGRTFSGKVVLIAAGKAAWQMANTAYECLGTRISGGVVITKYDHVMGLIGNLVCREAGHPVPDSNTFAATALALEAVKDLTEQDTAVPVRLGKETSVSAILGGDTGMLIDKAKKSAVTTEVALAESVTAPVSKGQNLGTMTVKAGDQVLAEVPLVAAEDVPRLTWWDLFVKVLRRVAMAK